MHSFRGGGCKISVIEKMFWSKKGFPTKTNVHFFGGGFRFYFIVAA